MRRDRGAGTIVEGGVVSRPLSCCVRFAVRDDNRSATVGGVAGPCGGTVLVTAGASVPFTASPVGIPSCVWFVETDVGVLATVMLSHVKLAAGSVMVVYDGADATGVALAIVDAAAAVAGTYTNVHVTASGNYVTVALYGTAGVQLGDTAVEGVFTTGEWPKP